MELVLLPHVGAGPFRLGMTVDEARAAARGLGRIAGQEADAPRPGQLVVVHDGFGLDHTLGFRSGRLVQVEVWRFRDEDADVRVTLDGTDVFRTRHKKLRKRLGDLGHTVETEYRDMPCDALPELNVILANESSFEYPTDWRGHPLHYDYVLLADRIA
ncbi:hypothetical protein [Streptomyces sp. NPDC050264]|uniref:hypothetical protein n=1 Tax=Streptomyces sp. NPDC050264 TaxID=3155038 RepID=UPI003428E15C